MSCCWKKLGWVGRSESEPFALTIITRGGKYKFNAQVLVILSIRVEQFPVLVLDWTAVLVDQRPPTLDWDTISRFRRISSTHTEFPMRITKYMTIICVFSLQLDKVIIVACCLAAVGCALQVDKDNNKNDHKEATRTARNVFLPPYNNGLFYNSPWNWNNNYYNNYNPYRSYPYPLAHYRYPGAAVAAAPVGPVAAVATGAVNPNDYRSPVLYSNDIRHPDGSYFYE